MTRWPTSFNPASIMDQTLREIRAGKKLREAFPFLSAPGDRETKRAEPDRP